MRGGALDTRCRPHQLDSSARGACPWEAVQLALRRLNPSARGACRACEARISGRGRSARAESRRGPHLPSSVHGRSACTLEGRCGCADSLSASPRTRALRSSLHSTEVDHCDPFAAVAVPVASARRAVEAWPVISPWRVLRSLSSQRAARSRTPPCLDSTGVTSCDGVPSAHWTHSGSWPAGGERATGEGDKLAARRLTFSTRPVDVLPVRQDTAVWQAWHRAALMALTARPRFLQSTRQGRTGEVATRRRYCFFEFHVRSERVSCLVQTAHVQTAHGGRERA